MKVQTVEVERWSSDKSPFVLYHLPSRFDKIKVIEVLESPVFGVSVRYVSPEQEDQRDKEK